MKQLLPLRGVPKSSQTQHIFIIVCSLILVAACARILRSGVGRDNVIGYIDVQASTVVGHDKAPTYSETKTQLINPEVINICPSRVKHILSSKPLQLNTSSVAQRYSQYMKYKDEIGGWMDPVHAEFVYNMSLYQHEHGIYGSVGEIGTHYGRYFFAIASTAAEGEHRVAMDLYEHQDKNIDGSGTRAGDKLDVFKRHATNLTYSEEDIDILSVDSTLLTPANFSERGHPAFRFFSVDGGHTYDITLSDMALAACSVHDQGIIIVDDFFSPAGWPSQMLFSTLQGTSRRSLPS